MNFDPLNYPYPSQRMLTYAKNGMVCASNPVAAQAGLDILKAGGNAIDAAVATATTMTVTEPTGNGLGSDAFVLIWYKDKLYGINGSGPAPKALSIDALKERGHEKIPAYGIESVVVPGAVSAWMKMHKEFGQLDIKKVMAPSIHYAEEGFPVSPNIARLWDLGVKKYTEFKDKKEFQPWFDTFTINGRAPKPGELFKSPDLAKSLKEIAETYGESFYRGELKEKIVKFFEEHNGFMAREDLENYEAEFVEPISGNYRGYDIWEIPPNGHGITVLMALNILKQFEFGEKDTIDTLHKQIEAMKLSFVDTQNYVTDPKDMTVTVEELLSEKYAKDRKALITNEAITPEVGDPSYGSTVYFATADAEGNMVSVIQSNYRGFGSGMVVPNTGISLNDRVENFSFNKEDDNALKGGKKPYHTIIPGFITKDGKAVGPFGIMGGFMQPQAHTQVVMNMIEFGLNPQSALDAPRWQWMGDKTIEVEQDFPNHILKGLQRKGHDIVVKADGTAMGIGEIIIRNENGILCGATEKRSDGTIASY